MRTHPFFNNNFKIFEAKKNVNVLLLTFIFYIFNCIKMFVQNFVKMEKMQLFRSRPSEQICTLMAGTCSLRIAQPIRLQHLY